MIALSLLVVAMAMQGLSPARAASMRLDAFGQPICSGDGVQSPSDDRKAPLHQTHDCCAAACAQAFAAIAPMQDSGVAIAWPTQARTRYAAGRHSLGPRGPPDRPPVARGPPTLA
ncbi:hypothetical protein ACO2Q3_14220 [Caulobacter sp. KR2-114]|uniref:hypothetical protein n=1 Tax=Caulobacter sp. KR2-114 TaxID=3400912 RepID=UPI003C081A46